MCNDYEQHVAWAEYQKTMHALELGILTGQTELDLPQSNDIRVNDTGPVIRATGNGIELVPMRFGVPPPRPKAPPVFNFRSEGRHFDKSNRPHPGVGLLRVHRHEISKAKHRFTLNGAPFLCIAGLWRETVDGETPAFTMLTTEPGPDIAPYHDRQIVVLQPADWVAWLYLARPESELLRPLPEGSLAVETVRQATA